MGLKSKFKRFFVLDDDDDDFNEQNQGQNQPEANRYEKQKKQNIVSLQSIQQSSKVVLIEPRAYSEAQEIADQLKNRRAVVINLQRVNREQARRIVDFLSGTVYAISGDIQKLGPETFLCTPDNVDVSGMISEMYQAD
jgi:cell division inhibitor SepF